PVPALGRVQLLQRNSKDDHEPEIPGIGGRERGNDPGVEVALRYELFVSHSRASEPPLTREGDASRPGCSSLGRYLSGSGLLPLGVRPAAGGAFGPRVSPLGGPVMNIVHAG